MHKNTIDITGQRFGRLVVIKQTKSDKHGNVIWECNCKCGNKTLVRGMSLRSGDTCSCGCLRNEQSTINTTGKNNPRYNSGLSFYKKQQRWFIQCRDNSKVLYSRVIFEGETGIKIPKGAVIHHINHDSTFDEIQNLAMFYSQSAHMEYHGSFPKNL